MVGVTGLFAHITAHELPTGLLADLQNSVAASAGIDNKWSQIEGHVAYVVDGARLRGLIGFRHTDLGANLIGNAIEIGLQTIQF